MGPLTKRIVRWLGVLLVASIVVRVSAQLIAPVIPLLVVLLILVLLIGIIFYRTPRP